MRVPQFLYSVDSVPAKDSSVRSATIRHLVNCPYTEPGKGYLRNKMNKRKGITTKNYICEDCGYAAKNILRDHRITVHKIGEKLHKSLMISVNNILGHFI